MVAVSLVIPLDPYFEGFTCLSSPSKFSSHVLFSIFILILCADFFSGAFVLCISPY
jgi:hypothetical protein